MQFAQLKQKLVTYKAERDQLAYALQALRESNAAEKVDAAEPDANAESDATDSFQPQLEEIVDGGVRESNQSIGVALQQMDYMHRIALLDHKIQALTNSKNQQLPHIKVLLAKIQELKRNLR